MKSKMLLIVGVMVLALGLVGTPASWANSLTVDGVTFDLSLSNNNTTLTLEISSAGILNGSAGWVTANGIAAFELDNIVTGTPTLQAVSSVNETWFFNNAQLSDKGCFGGGQSGANCFVGHPFFTFTQGGAFDLKVTITGATFDLTDNHLKVAFVHDGTTTIGGTCVGQNTGNCITGKVGSLLSSNIPGTSVPEPASLILLGAGLAGIGIWRRKVA